jgi:DNA (cytosine-5)-methyltransferase 1
MTFGSLFAGIGGLDLGLERAGMICKWQVEIDDYCRKVLTKHWPSVPKYGDIRHIDGTGLQPVDLIAAGYPCQPFSQAGQRKGEEDERHLFPEVVRIAGILRPRYLLLENVPGHLSLGFGSVLADLAGFGYDCEWLCLRASQFGASHLRKRVFIVATNMAHAIDGGSRDGVLADTDRGQREHKESLSKPGARSDALADAGDRLVSEPGRRPQGRAGVGSASAVLSDSGGTGLPDAEQADISGEVRDEEGRAAPEFCGAPLPFAPGPSDPRWPAILGERSDLAPAIESPVRGMADGLSHRLDGALSNRTKRLSRLGNAVVPQCAEWVGRRILEHGV